MLFEYDLMAWTFLALSRYGLFGIMWEVTMRVERNSRMEMEALHLNQDEFMRIHEASAADDVVMKLARLNILETAPWSWFIGILINYCFRDCNINLSIDTVDDREIWNKNKILSK